MAQTCTHPLYTQQASRQQPSGDHIDVVCVTGLRKFSWKLCILVINPGLLSVSLQGRATGCPLSQPQAMLAYSLVPGNVSASILRQPRHCAGFKTLLGRPGSHACHPLAL